MATEAARANTFPKLLLRNARLYAGRPAYRHKDLGIWQVWTWAQVLEEVRAFSVGLGEIGLKRDDKVSMEMERKDVNGVESLDKKTFEKPE